MIYLVESVFDNRQNPSYLGAFRSKHEAEQRILDYLADVFNTHMNQDFLTCRGKIYMYLPDDIYEEMKSLGFELKGVYEDFMETFAVEQCLITPAVLSAVKSHSQIFLGVFMKTLKLFKIIEAPLN